MFQKILLGTDLFGECDYLLEWLQAVKPIGIREIVLAHVICPYASGEEEKLLEEASDGLHRVAAGLESQGYSVIQELESGVPGRVLLELAEKHDVYTIIVGSHQSGNLRGALIGSTSYSVLHEADRPTFLIRKNNFSSYSIRHILYPTDFSETAERAFLFVEALVCLTGCDVTLFHVHDQARIDPYLRDRLKEFDRVDRGRLEGLKAHLELNGAGRCRIQLSYGVPAKRILNLFNSKEFNLMVMGTQGRGFIPEVFMGSTANAMARHAPLPVLFVPKQR